MQARIDELELRLVELQEQLAGQKGQLGCNPRNSSQPPSSGPVGVKRRPPQQPYWRKRGGQPQHRFMGETPIAILHGGPKMEVVPKQVLRVVFSRTA